MIKIFIFFIFISFCLNPFLFPDSEDDDNQSLSHSSFTEEIVVEGEVVSKTATVTTITAKEIEEKGIKNVAEALELIPGSYVRVGGSVGWSGFIWSFGKEIGTFQPVSGMKLFDFGHETRIRDLHLADSGDTVLAGFGKTKDGQNIGFIRLITVNK